MRIVVPVSAYDFNNLPQWISVVNHLNCLQQHDVHFITAPELVEYSNEAKIQLEGKCISCEVHPVVTQAIAGWPIGSNAYFWHAVNQMAKQPNLPWELVELDCLPIRSNAFDAISVRYASSGSPFFGRVAKTPGRNQTTGKISDAPEGPHDLMMSGCGVYPGNMPMLKGFGAFLDDFMKGMESTDIPFDVHIRHVARSVGIAHTDLIADHWNTINYRIEDGALVCELNPNHELYTKNPHYEFRDCGGTVNPAAVIVHGCKDSSLADLVLNNEIPDMLSNSKPVTISTALPPVVTRQENEKIAKLESKVDMLADLMKKMLEQKIAPVAQPEPEKTEVTSTVTPESVLQALGGRKQKLADLAAKMGIESKQLRSIVLANPTVLVLSPGPAGWIGAA